VRQRLIRLIGPVQELDDLHQTALLRVLQGIGEFRGQSSLKTWVDTVCVNVAKNHYRFKSRARVSVADSDEPLDVVDPASGDLHSALEAKETLKAYLKALDTLSATHRMAYVLKVVEGYSVDEVAAIMKAARSTTRLRLYYARKALFKALRSQDAESLAAAVARQWETKS
jgi:RNA polymerase sigma-70 factor (ECF subfamily)